MSQYNRRVVYSRLSNAWPEQLRGLIPIITGLAFVAGGYARKQILVGWSDIPEPSDIDLFLFNAVDFDSLIASLMMYGYQDGGSSFAAVTLTHPNEDYLPLQIVRPLGQTAGRGRHGTPEQVMDSFDFTVNQFAIVAKPGAETQSVVGYTATTDQSDLRLVIVNNSNPLALVYRIIKYAAKGYWMPRSESAKLFTGWDAGSEKMKRWVRETLSTDESDMDMDLLYALTNGLIGVEDLLE